MRAYPPLPIRSDWMPSYLFARGTANRDFAFWYPDPQGMPSHTGRRYHGAVDWFAPALTLVKAPLGGRVVRAQLGSKTTGQVFGGVLTIQTPDGPCFVMRHVDPLVGVGQAVDVGQVVARVTDWRDGGDHLHLEIWRKLSGGYVHENCIDPKTVEWAEDVLLITPEPVKPPPPDGNTLRASIQSAAERRAGLSGRKWAGWGVGEGQAGGALAWFRKNPLPTTSRMSLAFQGTVRRYRPERPEWVEITHPDGSVQHITPKGGGAKYMAAVAATFANKYLT